MTNVPGLPQPPARLVSGNDTSLRLSAGRQAKIRALVSAAWGDGTDRQSHIFTGGAALTEGGTGRAWVLIDDGEPRGFGAALAWATRRGLNDVDILVEGGQAAAGGVTTRPSDPAGVIARRAALWSNPPGVWIVRGRRLEVAEPAPFEPAAVAPSGALAFVEVLAGHGVEPVVEHGAVTGEILGLEVVRVVPTSVDWSSGEDTAEPAGWRMEVGVGRHDREARAEMRAGQGAIEALDEVVADVRARRTARAVAHPANRLARERWLRVVVMARPELVGAMTLSARPTARPRTDLRVAVPAPAAGVDDAGRPVVVVCSIGVDVDLVPTAADIRARDQPGARLILAVPAGDDYPVTYELAAGLVSPADVVTVPGHWPALGPGEQTTGTLVDHVGTPERT